MSRLAPARSVTPSRIAEVVGELPTRPAYAGLAEALRLAIGDGRLPAGVRLPSERDLAQLLGLSRTTVTRAYASLRGDGYAHAQQGAGTFTRIPGGRARTWDRALTTRVGDDAAIDLNCAASSALPGLAGAYQAAVAELPAYLSGHGYYPAGLPELQQRLADGYRERGLATDPVQVFVTVGALTAAAIAARVLVRPGDRVLVEVPGYPNAAQAFKAAGARLVPVPVDAGGWDLDLVESTLRRLRPRAAYLGPDFHNPTGALMDDADRGRLARALAEAGTVAVIDEVHQALALDGRAMPRPLAAHLAAAGGRSITVSGASKMLWGGLRLGWARVDPDLVDAYGEARLTVDLGAPVVEQLALTHLLDDLDHHLTIHRARLREQRDALAGAPVSGSPTGTSRPPRAGSGCGHGSPARSRPPSPTRPSHAGWSSRRVRCSPPREDWRRGCERRTPARCPSCCAPPTSSPRRGRSRSVSHGSRPTVGRR
ncbi:MAG: PLP-dependent aminotransferase family protein [Nocardioidaceae bacterium]